MMNYKIINDNSEIIESGVITATSNITCFDVPISGSIHIELFPGKWLNVRTTEYISVEVTNEVIDSVLAFKRCFEKKGN